MGRDLCWRLRLRDDRGAGLRGLAMRGLGLGQIIFAASMMLAGALSFAFRDFALVFGEVPKTIAGHDALVWASAAILLLAGAALLVPRTARIAALVLAIVLLLFTLLCHVRPLVTHPLVELSWYALGETLVLAAGAWILFSMQPARRGAPLAKLGHVRAGQLMFGGR
jgi:uncharacterized membrane protein